MTSLSALIVDDNPMMRSIIEKAISAAGISDIDYAGNGVEALRGYRNRHHDLIVLDNIMPRMTGLEFLMELRADPAVHKTHIIMVTGIVDHDLIALIRGQRMKVNDLLVKPFDVQKLQQKVVDFVARRARAITPTKKLDDYRPAPPDATRQLPPTLTYCIINRGALAILELTGHLTDENKVLVNTALKEIDKVYAELIVLDLNNVDKADDFGYGTIMIAGGYLETLGKQAYLSLDDCPLKDRIIALGITNVIPTRERAADALDL